MLTEGYILAFWTEPIYIWGDKSRSAIHHSSNSIFVFMRLLFSAKKISFCKLIRSVLALASVVITTLTCYSDEANNDVSSILSQQCRTVLRNVATWQTQAISEARKGAILSPELICITACIFILMSIA